MAETLMPAYPEQTAVNTKQAAEDNTLNTTAKTIVGAINEHESDLSTLNWKINIHYGALLMLSNDFTNTTENVSFKIGTVPKKFIIESWKYGELPDMTMKVNGTTIGTARLGSNMDNAWEKTEIAVSNVSAGSTITISIAWSNSFSGNKGHYNLHALYEEV